jgi:D-serine deaminase-like pyridoxal phosphate-dependent protein
MTLSTYPIYKAIFAGRRLPFAYVDLDLMAANTRDLVARSAGKSIRVASKSVRSVPVLRQILAADPSIQGVMCFTAEEAVHLAAHGMDDLLIGYPTVQPAQIEAAADLTRQGKAVTLMVDCAAHVERIEAIAAARGVILPVCLDIDLSLDVGSLHFGVWRSGITSVDRALEVYAAIERSPHVRLDGVMGYEAQIAGVGDKGRAARAQIIRLLKRRSIPMIVERRAAIVAALKDRGAALRFVNGGGTGSLESTTREEAVTEVTIGSGFYSPALFDHYTAFRHHPAAGFALEIIRTPKPGLYTCLGGGYIASGATGPEKQPRPYLPEGAALTPLEGAGEVQTPIRYDGPERLAIGDPIFLRHSKAGELCEHFNTLLLVRGGQIVDEVPTYRGEGCAFL